MPIRIVIADDHALLRQGLKALLKQEKQVAVVGEVDRADDIGPLLEKARADILILDLAMDRNALPDIATLSKQAKVIVVTASEEPEDALAALRAGAQAVVLKRSTPWRTS